ALDPAADLVPVLVEERDHRDGLIAVVQVGVPKVGLLVPEEHAQLTARDRLADVRDQRRVAVDVTAPVLRDHHRVLDLVDTAEELPLVVGQPRLRVVVLSAGPRIAHLGHVILPGQAFGEALGVEGNLELSHRVSPLLVVRLRARPLYTKSVYTQQGGEDSDGPDGKSLGTR